MFAHRFRRRPNIKTTLGQRLVFGGRIYRRIQGDLVPHVLRSVHRFNAAER